LVTTGLAGGAEKRKAFTPEVVRAKFRPPPLNGMYSEISGVLISEGKERREGERGEQKAPSVRAIMGTSGELRKHDNRSFKMCRAGKKFVGGERVGRYRHTKDRRVLKGPSPREKP